MDKNDKEKIFKALETIIYTCLRTAKCDEPCKCPFYDICKHGLDISPYLWRIDEEKKEVFM